MDSTSYEIKRNCLHSKPIHQNHRFLVMDSSKVIDNSKMTVADCVAFKEQVVRYDELVLEALLV